MSGIIKPNPFKERIKFDSNRDTNEIDSSHIKVIKQLELLSVSQITKNLLDKSISFPFLIAIEKKIFQFKKL